VNVQLIDVMGTDLTVVNAARVSMSKESLEMCDQDERLIAYLARHNHWTPFAHPQITLRIRMPIFVARQWFKHQIGITRNEVSRRYVSDEPEFFMPATWRARAANVKQGSSTDAVRDTYEVQCVVAEVYRAAHESYTYLLQAGVCPEQARMVLPQAMFTEFVETGSLAAYARLARLRLDPHAQLEVREYAQQVADIIAPLFPVSWKEVMA
jgi:thymidylate synthase (FAD)